MLYVLDWCVVCTGLVCCMHWTGVLYALKPVARSGKGGVRKVINVDLTSGR